MVYKLCIIGSGYVGLTTAACFASRGMDVVCIDLNKQKVDLINKGISPIYEPGLDEILSKAVLDGKLRATDDYADGMEQSDFTFICVNTPSKKDGSIDLSYVVSATEKVGENLKVANRHHTVVVKSTVLPGTTSNVIAPILKSRSGMVPGVDFNLTFNPEFLSEGSAVRDTFHPDRIVIGEYTDGSGHRLLKLYEEFYGKDLPTCIVTTTVNAEIIKYASNAFLATKISFINEIANICQRLPGADVEVVARGMGLDRRIGVLFLKAGLGFAGPCLPKDLSAFIQYSKSLGYNPKLLLSVKRLNEKQPYRAIELAKELLGDLSERIVAILGLAFKPNTDDVRDAVSIKIVKRLLKMGAKVKVYDPKAIENVKSILKDRVEYASSAIDCIKNADCCIIVTEWEEFKDIKPEEFVRYMRNPIVIDGRRVYNPSDFQGKITYVAIGYNPKDR